MGKNSKNILKFVTPANATFSTWREGLPTGNGTIGLNVLGGVGRETIIVNHTDLWWQGKTSVLPDVSDKVKNIAKNLDTLSYREAETVLTNALIGKNYKPECAYPLPLCDFILTTPIDSSINDYSRSINLESGEVKVEYKIKNNIKFDRSIFVSHVNNTICYLLEANASKRINCSFTIALHDKTNNRTANYDSFEVGLVGETKTDKDYITFSARNDDGTDFGCVAKVICSGGTITKTADKFAIKNADRVLILAKTFVGARKEMIVPDLEEELALIKMPYEKLLKEHTAIHSKIVSSCEINLNGQGYENINMSYLDAKTGEIPLSLIESMYLFGKHLFACSCGNKINPCGLFTGDYKAYRSTTENYVQLQRMLDFSFKSGLSKELMPLFDKIYDNLDDYKKNSTRLYGCKGIFIPSLEAPESGLPGSTVPGVIMNYNVASYISAMIYQYYLQTDDVEFLKEKGYEIIEEAGLFYDDFMKINRATKKFETTFGYSPYNTPSNVKTDDDFSIASNCTADFVCAKFVFSTLVTLSKALFKEDEEIEKWQKMLDSVPDIEIDKNGYIKEYNSNAFETNHSSPYIPHLFPYNIGLKPYESKRDFEDLVANSIKFRYINSFGKFNSGNLCDMSTALATCGDAVDSYEILKTLIKNFLTSNLILSSGDNSGMGVGTYEAWPSFEIDKNIGICTAIQNMFINSGKDDITLFRALPTEFTKGSISNIVLNNQIKADIDFNMKRGLVVLKLKSPKATLINVNLPNGLKRVKGVNATQVDLQNNVLNELNLQANKNCVLKIYFKNTIDE